MPIRKTKSTAPSVKAELKLALEMGEIAGALMLKSYEKDFKVRHKGAIDLVTEVDLKIQATLIKKIKKTLPGHAILAEEGDYQTTAKAESRWIIDPLDGTTNFAHGYPRFCTSIAFERNGVLEVGVVYDPLLKEMYRAVRGGGAYLNKRKLAVSKATNLKSSLLVTGFPYDLDDPQSDNVPYFLHLLKQAQAIRRDGSAALNMAYVAAGRFDGYWEFGLKPWDIAAGILLIREAGGLVQNISGAETEIEDLNLIAAGPKVFDELAREMKKLPRRVAA